MPEEMERQRSFEPGQRLSLFWRERLALPSGTTDGSAPVDVTERSGEAGPKRTRLLDALDRARLGHLARFVRFEQQASVAATRERPTLVDGAGQALERGAGLIRVVGPIQDLERHAEGWSVRRGERHAGEERAVTAEAAGEAKAHAALHRHTRAGRSTTLSHAGETHTGWVA